VNRELLLEALAQTERHIGGRESEAARLPANAKTTASGRSARIVSTEAECAEKAGISPDESMEHTHSVTNECRICRAPAADHSVVCDSCARGERSGEELRAEILKLAASGLSELDMMRWLSDVRMARFHQQSVRIPAKREELAGLRSSFEAFYRLEISQHALLDAQVQQ
jgi:hypothetical protein